MLNGQAVREGKNGITKLGLFKQNEFTQDGQLKDITIRLVPYGKQDVIVIHPKVMITKNRTGGLFYFSATLYKQRNGKYILKFKETLVEVDD